MKRNSILSWKINTGTYAYIYLPNSSSRISGRIPEDSSIWPEIIEKVNDYDAYIHNFAAMSGEVMSKYGVEIPWDENYFNFGSGVSTNIVLLAGKDGVDGTSGANGSNGGSSTGNTGDEVYDEFNKALDEKFKEIREDIERQNEEVKNFIETEVTQTILDAKKTINDTKEKLDSVRKDLEERLSSAAEALEKAAALFEMGEGNIDSEAIMDALSSVSEYGSWLANNSGYIQTLKIDYDAAKRILGGVGSAEDALAGLFSQIGTTINAMNNTVGTVQRWMVASAATIGDIANWYNVNSSESTEAMRFINASGGVICDTINYINDKGEKGYTAVLQRQMDAKDASIKDTIMAETRSGITNVSRTMDALSGTIRDSITRLSSVDSALTTMEKWMDASGFTMGQYMTKTDEAMSLAIDLRDHWSAESGKLSTVASLTAQVDEEGNVMYFVSGSTDSESDDIRVWKGEDGVWRDANGTSYKEEEVTVHYSKMMASYIQQQTSSITMSIVGEDLTAAIKLAITEDSSVISMIADEVVIDADLIAKAISAKTANIGGILIGDGKIECMKTDGRGQPLFLLDGHDGSLYAKNAYIEGEVRATSGQFNGAVTATTGQFNGAITATSLTLGGTYGDKSLKDYVDGRIPSGVTSSADIEKIVNEYVNSQEFKDSITDGYITEQELEEWAKSQSGLTEDDVRALIKEVGNTEVNTTFTSTTENGQTKYVLTIGDQTYEWYTYKLTDQDGNGFVVLNRPYSGKTDNNGTTEPESGKTSVLISTKGLLQASNAVIHGCIYAIAGEIGGLKLRDSRLMVSRNGNYNDSIAYLNGSSTYSDSERGTIILAAGLSSGHTYYKYTSSESKRYSTIYTKKRYLIKNGDENGCEVEAYEYNASTKSYVRLRNQFYFLTTESKEQSSEDYISTTDSEGNRIFINQYVARKYYTQTSQDDGYLDEMEEKYSYAGTVSVNDVIANTKIFEDGTIISNTLVANDGYFGGEINAIGKFKGTLENVGGTLKGVTIDANLINGNIVLRNSDSIKAKSNSRLYFNVGKEPLSDKSTKEYWNIDEFSWAAQNSNGTNEGIWYNNESTIAYVPFKSGATITIPALNGSLYRYAANGKTNYISYLWVECNAFYNGSSTEKNLIYKILAASEHDHSTTPTDSISTTKYTFTAEADGVLSITFGYDVHLSTYSWLNADKSYASIKFNTGGSKITVDYPRPTEGVSIASNGMRVLTVSGASVSILDNTITLLSPNKKYGLKITDNGVQIRKNSTSESSWTNL